MISRNWRCDFTYRAVNLGVAVCRRGVGVWGRRGGVISCVSYLNPPTWTPKPCSTLGLFGYLSGFGALYIYIYIRIIQGVGLIRFYKVLVGYHFPK